MAKIIKYNLCTLVNHGTEEEPKIEEILSPITMGWNEVNEETAKREAYKGEYTIEEIPEPFPTASRNITAGECFTIAGVLYKATENIPNGEPIITGQNALETTIEEQLAELAIGE